MHPFSFLPFFTALPPNWPLFKTTNNSSTRRFFISLWIGLHTYMHDATSTGFLAFPSLFYIVSIFRGREGEGKKRMKIQSMAIFRNARFRKMKNEREKRTYFPRERLNLTV